jgi:pimeloyl-ACP methyl ester carboxylesterase
MVEQFDTPIKSQERVASACVRTRACVGVLALAAVLSGCAPSAEDCGKLSTQSGMVDYCIHKADQTNNPDVLYYFHGFVLDEHPEPLTQWSRGDARLFSAWLGAGLARPTFIAVSWGRKWILKDDKLAAFQNEIIPQLESKLGVPSTARRMVMGDSLGGLNAFIAWAKAPHLFHSAAFRCPAFTEIGPDATESQKLRVAEAMLSRRADVRDKDQDIGESLVWLNGWSAIVKPLFGSTEEWLRFQPPLMMESLRGQKLPPAYLINNRRDQFGFNDAPEIGAAGHSITYEVNNGGHCEIISTDGLVRFLSDRPLDWITLLIERMRRRR